MLFRKPRDRVAFRRFVRDRRGGRGRRELRDRHALKRHESNGFAVTDRDRAGLIKQQHVNVTRCLNRASRHRDHVRFQHAAHAGNANRGQQTCDRGRHHADKERDHRDHADRRPAGRHFRGIERERHECRAGEKEDHGHSDQHDREGHFVRRPAPPRAVHHRNHLVEEGVPRFHIDPRNQPVREHTSAADNRVRRDHVSRLNQNEVTLLQVLGEHKFRRRHIVH